jgi:hypothetical protein
MLDHNICKNTETEKFPFPRNYFCSHVENASLLITARALLIIKYYLIKYYILLELNIKYNSI